MEATPNAAQKNGFAVSPSYYSFHDRLSILFDGLANALFVLLFLVAAISYLAAAVSWLGRSVERIFAASITAAQPKRLIHLSRGPRTAAETSGR